MAAPVADVFRCYYDVSNFSVNSLTLCYCVVYILFAIPSAFFLARHGLRVTMIFAITMSAFGTSLRVIGTGKYFTQSGINIILYLRHTCTTKY